MSVMSLQAMPVAIAAFAASLVEFVEALTVVLAVGATRGWRSALAGSGAAAVALVALVLLLGPLLAVLPVGAMQVAIGLLLLLFGLRWLRKAVLRSAGVIPLHDEAAAFAQASQSLGAPGSRSGWDAAGLATAFQITLLEGIEVVFIVVAIGAGRRDLLATASLGAAAALVAVVVLGVALHRPLARVPENALKFVVGALLCAFGTFWIGEGAGLPWPGADWSLLGMGAGFLLAGLLAARLCRAGAGTKALPTGAAR